MGKTWRDRPRLIPDTAEARYWFEQAARQGHLVAQYSLAKLYLSNGLEVRDADTEEEGEKLPAELIAEMKTEAAAEKERLKGESKAS